MKKVSTKTRESRLNCVIKTPMFRKRVVLAKKGGFMSGREGLEFNGVARAENVYSPISP